MGTSTPRKKECFGLMTSTILVLVLVPTFYNLYAKVFGISVDSVAQKIEATGPETAPASGVA